MRKWIFLCVGLFFVFAAYGQGGVNFQELTFYEALTKAKAENKFVFIDCYTSWCGPCKQMADNVFPQQRMGEYFNAKFVCLKIDMEKGEGPELMKKFGIAAFPTFVVVNADGVVRHKIIGADEGPNFIARVEESFDDAKALGVVNAKYDEGNRDKSFLAAYIEALGKVSDPKQTLVADELFSILTEEEKFSPDYWFLYTRQELAPRGSSLLKFLKENREKFNASRGKAVVDGILGRDYRNALFRVLFAQEDNSTLEQLEEMQSEVIALKLENDKTLLPYFEIAKAIKVGDMDQLLSVCEQEFEKLPLGSIPRYLFKVRQEKATPDQLERWDKLLERYTKN